MSVPCGWRPTRRARSRSPGRAAAAHVQRRGPPLRARARHRPRAGRAPRRTRSRLDGERVWPLPDNPPSVLRTHAARRPGADRVRLLPRRRPARAAPQPAQGRGPAGPRGRRAAGVRAAHARAPARGLAARAAACWATRSTPTRSTPTCERRIAGEEVESFADYAKLYRAAWGEPVIRWLLSTVPSAMIFDDHDVHDDWNTSRAWVEEMRRQGWWRERIVAAFSSYLVYQHLGNLSPEALEELELYRELREAPDATERLRAFAREADQEVAGKRWSFCWDVGPARVVMIDSRAGRVLDPGHRAMVDADEWDWIARHATGRRRPPADRHVAARRARARRCTTSRPGTRRWPRARGAGSRRARPRSCGARSTSSTGRRSMPPIAPCAGCCATSAPAAAAPRRPRSACCPATSTTRTSLRSASGPATACAPPSGRRCARRSATRWTRASSARSSPAGRGPRAPSGGRWRAPRGCRTPTSAGAWPTTAVVQQSGGDAGDGGPARQFRAREGGSG